ncbi:MAG: hypothetical protein RJA78_684 [Actinomycetota bacterium]|jgi:hypothetical protein
MGKSILSFLMRLLQTITLFLLMQLVLLETIYGLISFASPDTRTFHLLPLDQVGFMYVLLLAGKVDLPNLIFVFVWSILLLLILFSRISGPGLRGMKSFNSSRIVWTAVGLLALIQLPLSQSFTPVVAAACFIAVARYLPLPSRLIAR